MSSVAHPRRGHGRRAAIWVAVVASLLLVVAANAHLVYVAMTSQPACVSHRVAGEDRIPTGAYGAAQSDCAPSRVEPGMAEPERGRS